MLPDGFPERPVQVVLRVEGFKVIRSLSDLEISDGEVSQSPLLVSNKVLDVVEFGSGLLQHFTFDAIVLLVPVQASDLLESIFQDSNQVVDSGSVLDSLTEKLSVTRLEDNVPVDGSGLGKFEIAVNKVGEVGEI